MRRQLLWISIVVSGCSLLASDGLTAENECRSAPPSFAADQGFTERTFFTNFAASDVVLNFEPGKSGQWYRTNFFGHVPLTSQISKSREGFIVEGSKWSRNSEIATAVPGSRLRGFSGTAFGGGGYFEVELRLLSPSRANDAASGWPALWMLPIEGLFRRGGTPSDFFYPEIYNFRRNVEVDIFEHMYDAGRGAHTFGIAMHDWYGVYGVTCQGMCQSINKLKADRLTENVDLSAFQSYGFLWVPATDSTKGYGEFYLNRNLIGRSSGWRRWSVKAPLPPSGDDIYSILDRLHMVMIVGGGIEQPVEVRCAAVWQVNGASNWVNTARDG